MKELVAMSLEELKSHRKDVDKAIENYEKRKRKEALAEIERAARQHGFSLADLTSQKDSRKGKNPPKYMNPDDPSKSWSGKGRKPQWIHDALSEGKALDEFLIAK